MSEQLVIKVIRPATRKTVVLRWKDPATLKDRMLTTSIPTADTPRNQAAIEREIGALRAKVSAGIIETSTRTTWARFRQLYREQKIPTMRERGAQRVEIVLDRVEEIIGIHHLADLTTKRVDDMVARMRTGYEYRDAKGKIRKRRPISEATVHSYLGTLAAALNWAKRRELLTRMPTIEKPPTKTVMKAKGRALNLEEFEKLIMAVPHIVGEQDAPAWVRFLNGLWLGGWRMEEALMMSWDDPAGISPTLQKVDGVVEMTMHIPPGLDKEGSEKDVMVADEFRDFLLETPESERTGPIFPLYARVNRPKISEERMLLTPGSVSKTVSKMGQRAGIVVARDKRGKPSKYASCHDLRRSFGTRQANSGDVEVFELMQMMRHQKIETTLAFYAELDALKMARNVRRRRAAREQAEKEQLGRALGRAASIQG